MNPQTDVFQRDPIREAFEDFHAAHPEVFEYLSNVARSLLRAGRDRISMKQVWEVARYRMDIAGKPYKLNNNYTSLYARALIAAYPELGDVIETRTRKGAA